MDHDKKETLFCGSKVQVACHHGIETFEKDI